jgi:amino acid transporter
MFISNLFGTRVLTLINYFAVATLFLLLGLLIVFNLNFLNLGFGIAGEALSGSGSANVNPKNVWNISVLLFWAFLGWENLSFSLGEIENPEKNVPRLYWFSFVLVAAIYILLALISVGASVSGVALKGAAGLSSLVLLTPGGNVLVWLIIFVIAANACSWNFTASRLLYAGGRTGIFPAVFGRISKQNVPVFALASLYTLSALLLTGTYFLKISLADIMLIVNQNFIFLCSFVILAYWRTETRREKWVFAFAALLSLSILASGFTWKAIYPLFLIGLGYFRFLKHTDERVEFRREFRREIREKIKRESIQHEEAQERSFLKD